MFKFFLWMIFILRDIRTVWDIKTWYSSKCPNTPKSKNVLIPPYSKISHGAKET